MRFVCGLLVCALWVNLATADPDADYWRIRTRAKLSIERARRGHQPSISIEVMPGPPPAGKAADVEPMTFYTFDGCVPCAPFKDDIKAGKFPFPVNEFDITKRDPPDYITTVPAVDWKGADGTKWIYPPPNAPENRRGYPGADALIQMWRKTQERKSNAPRGPKIRVKDTAQTGVIRQASYSAAKPGWVVRAAMGKRVQAVLITG